jgi:cholesterol oxidase
VHEQAAVKLRGSLPNVSDRLGYLVRTNSESILAVTARDDERDFTRGVAITSSIYPDPDTHIEPVTYGKGADSQSLLFALMTEAGGRGTQPLHVVANMVCHPLMALRALRIPAWSRRTVILLVMQTLDNAMRLKVKRRWPNGNVVLTTEQDPDNPNPDKTPAAYRAAEWIQAKIGGTAQAMFTEATFAIPTTAHILGGAVIGGSPRTGVVDERQRIFGYEKPARLRRRSGARERRRQPEPYDHRARRARDDPHPAKGRGRPTRRRKSRRQMTPADRSAVLRLHREGAGEPLLLIHGIGSSLCC